MKRAALAIGLLLLFGAARLPVEIHLSKLQRKAGFHSVKRDLSLRDQLSQSAYLAALGGFRSLVAAVLWIDAHDSWEKIQWGPMMGKLQTVTTLQPKSITYWDMSGWHAAWNASIAAMDDKKKQSIEALRKRASDEYIERGRKFYEDGLRNNPDSAELWYKYGYMLQQRLHDHAGASKAFAVAATKPGARPYYKRLAAFELAQVPGREREAYDRMMAIYNDGDAKDRVPTLITLIKRLEEKLGIPADQRIKEPNPH